MGQLRAFVTKLIMSRVRTFWVLFGLRLYSDSRCLAKNWPSKRVCRLLGPVKRSKFRFFGQSHSHQTFTMSHINQMDWTCIEKNTVSEIRLIGQTYQANLVSGPAKLLGAWQRRYCRFQDRAPDFFLGDFLGEDPDDAFFSAFFFSSELSGHLHPHPHTTPDGIINIWILYKTSQECLCHCLFIGQVMSPHHSDQMSQGSQVSWVALCMSISKVPWVSESVTRSPIELFWTAKNDASHRPCCVSGSALKCFSFLISNISLNHISISFQCTTT